MGALWVAVFGFVACQKPVEVPLVRGDNLDETFRKTLGQARADVLREPGSGSRWGHYGQALEAAEFLAEARRCYRQALALEPLSARWSHLLGLLELQESPEVGLKHLEAAVRLERSTEDASRVRLAQALVERGRNPEALPHLEALLASRPDHAAARLEMARIRLSDRRLVEAADLVGPCLTNPYTARPAILLMSQIRAREGNTELAVQLSRRGAGMPKPFDWPDPYQREVQALRADRAKRAEKIQGLLAQGRLQEAEALVKSLLEGGPLDTEGRLLHGRLLLQQRRCEEAEKVFQACLDSGDVALNALTQLALAQLCQQKWSEAEGTLDRALALKPDFALAHANRAFARSRRGNATGAIVGYRDAIRCSPGDAGVHAGLAEELMRAGKLEESGREVAMALSLDSQNARAKAVQARLKGGGK